MAAVRIALLLLMFASLAMSSATPEAFDDRATLFAAAYVALTLGRTLFALVGFPLRRVFTRPLVWWCLAGVLWIVGAATEGADDLVIEHPSAGAGTAVTIVILGGPALYLLANLWFQWALWDHVARSRIVGLVALCFAIPLAALDSRLALLIAATAVLAVLAIRDTRIAFTPGG